MSEGQEVRRAYAGPDIDHDTLIGRAAQHNAEDASRSSSAAETRQDIGAFLEETGLNNKAYSMLRQIMKIADKSQDKAMDVIRSLKKGLPMIENHVGGQHTQEMDFDAPQQQIDPTPEPSPDEQAFNADVDAAMSGKPVDFGGADE